jgi:Dolichyl-phosphate-mannose-protein mannosyltransferase
VSQEDVLQWATNRARPLNKPAASAAVGAEVILNKNDKRWRAACLCLLALYALLFAFNAVTRTRNFEDPDTMNFVDIARHIAHGEGVRQATLGFNQPVFDVHDKIPTPLTHQPPLYPLVIATLSRVLRLPVTDVALFVSVLCYGFVLLAGYAIARRLFGVREALATVLLLSLYAPLREFSRSAFSEPVALAFMLTSLWLLVVYAAAPARRTSLAALAGLIAATAVATRYALAPLVVVGACFVFIQRGHVLPLPDGKLSPGKARLRDTVLFLLGPAIIAAVLIGRNLTILSGSLVPRYLPSTTGPLQNFRNVLASLSSDYADPIPDLLQFVVLLAVVVGLLELARRRGRLQPVLTSTVLSGRSAQLLTAFALAYVLFLVAERSHSFIDPIGARYLLPAAVVIVVLFAAFIVRASAMHFRGLAIAGSLVALIMVGFEARTALVTPAYRIQNQIDKSERLKWIQQHTTNADLIIGEDTVDIPFYFHRTAVVSYSPFPYTETLPYPKIIGLCERFKSNHDRVLLVLRRHSDEQWDVWENRLGPFIHSAAVGQIDKYPQLTPVAELQDGRVFEVGC